MTFSTRIFRNINGSPEDPVSTWPAEAFTAVLAYGGLPEYRPVALEIQSDPWGWAAQCMESALAAVDLEDEENPVDLGAYRLFEYLLSDSRRAAASQEREEVAAQLRRLVKASGLSQADFALRCGTSRSRLSTYLNAKVSPRADFMVRAMRVSERAVA